MAERGHTSNSGRTQPTYVTAAEMLAQMQRLGNQQRRSEHPAWATLRSSGIEPEQPVTFQIRRQERPANVQLEFEQFRRDLDQRMHARHERLAELAIDIPPDYETAMADPPLYDYTLGALPPTYEDLYGLGISLRRRAVSRRRRRRHPYMRP